MLRINLSHEILIDIFLRLPARSIGRCRCVSKAWRSLLSTPHFIKSHLARQTQTHQQDLILIAPFSVYTMAAVKHDPVSRKIEIFPDSWIQIAGSCDGLILFVNAEGKFLVNLVTQQHVKLPNSPLALPLGESFSMDGFGYDHLGDDYKVVTLSYYDTDTDYKPPCFDTFVDVYSVKSGFWNRVQNSPFDHHVPQASDGVFVNGAIHWLAWPNTRHFAVIAAFDLVAEAFSEIPAPSSVDLMEIELYELTVLGDCLCIVDTEVNTWMFGL